MEQSQIDADELEPEIVIAILRDRILEARRRVTGLRIDIQVVESVPGHSADEVEALTKNLEAARLARDAYQAKLDVISQSARQPLP